MSEVSEYHALTVDVKNGKTYWNQSQKDVKAVHAHLKRYCNRHCHVFIFTKNNNEDGDLILKEHIKNYNGKRSI